MMTYKEFRNAGRVFDIVEGYILLEGKNGNVHRIPRRNVTGWKREDFRSDDSFLAAVWLDILTSPDCAAVLETCTRKKETGVCCKLAAYRVSVGIYKGNLLCAECAKELEAPNYVIKPLH